MAYNSSVLTVVETTVFQGLWPNYWTEEERGEFAAHVAANPDAGDPIPRSGGCRKIRWTRAGSGKRGGVRVIYFNRKQVGEVVLLVIYAKSALDNISANVLKELRDAAEKASQ